MRGVRTVLWVALMVPITVCAGAAAGETGAKLRLTVTETCLAKIHTGNISGGQRFTASPDNRHEAHMVAPFGKPMTIALDGQAYGPGCQGIWDGSVLFSPDSKRLAYVAGAAAKARRSVILDGVEGKQYDDVVSGSLIFSQNSAHFAYLAKKGARWLAVVDGVEMKEYDEVLVAIAFDAEGKRVAYAAKADGPSTGSGSPPAVAEGTPRAEPTGGKWFMVVDGKEGDRHDLALFPVFSDDGNRLGYVARDGDQSFAVVDGARQEGHGNLAMVPPVFSPDGKHFAYVAKREEAWSVVADGIEGVKYDAAYGMTYSPDSARLGYYARRGDKTMVVVDGVEGQLYDKASWLTFSPDSRRVAYAAVEGEKRVVVVDGTAGQGYEVAAAPAFGPDSKRLAYIAMNGSKVMVVVDGVESRAYDGFFSGTFPVFDSPTHLHMLVRSGPDLDATCVEIEIVEE